MRQLWQIWQFGDNTKFKWRGWTFFEQLRQDAIYTMRTFGRNPGFTLVAVLTLALGVGANTAVFSAISSVLLDPVPYPEPSRLVVLNHFYPDLERNFSVSAVGYAHYKDNNRSFEHLAAFSQSSATLTDDGEPETLRQLEVTPNLFDTYGVAVNYGRGFQPEEGEIGRNRVAVLADSYWHRRFGGQEDVVGRAVTINGESYEIVGVLPERFAFVHESGFQPDIYTPIAFTPAQLSGGWMNEFLDVVGRLRPDVSVEQAQADMDSIVAGLETLFNRESPFELALRPYSETIVGDVRPSLLVLFGAAGLLLLLACANVATLLMARTLRRRTEIAIRTSLGARWERTVRQILTEGLLLATLGGAVGLALASVAMTQFSSLAQAVLPRTGDLQLNYQVLVFALAVSMVTGILFGLAPLLQSARMNPSMATRSERATGGGARIRHAFVVSQIAIALVLLVAGGLLLQSFRQVQQVAPGFDEENVLLMQVSLPEYSFADEPSRKAFYDQALEALRSAPGTVSAGIVSSLPLSGSVQSGSFEIEGRPVSSDEPTPNGDRWVASSGYFETMRIPLLEGRVFTEQDDENAPSVVIIDETLAERYWPTESAVGHRITFQGASRSIVGVVGHVKHNSLEAVDDRVQYYTPYGQNPVPYAYMVVRTTGDPFEHARSALQAIRSVDPDFAPSRTLDMESLVSSSLGRRTLLTTLMTAFAAVALAVAVVGLYGLVSYSVVQQVHDIGVRVALGANRSSILRMMMSRCAILVALGVSIGLVGALGFSRYMQSQVFGVTTQDPVTFATAIGFLALTALVASYVPARRAMRVDPMDVLRHE